MEAEPLQTAASSCNEGGQSKAAAFRQADAAGSGKAGAASLTRKGRGGSSQGKAAPARLRSRPRERWCDTTDLEPLAGDAMPRRGLAARLMAPQPKRSQPKFHRS